MTEDNCRMGYSNSWKHAGSLPGPGVNPGLFLLLSHLIPGLAVNPVE